MKPTSLKTGMRVLIKSARGGGAMNHGVFIRRVPRQLGKPAHSIIRVAEFSGLDGPQDLGDTPYSDYDVSRRVSLQLQGDITNNLQRSTKQRK